MSFNNHNKFLFDHRNKILATFGKDTTGEVIYQINGQGFRNYDDYIQVPDYAFFGGSSLFGIGVQEQLRLTSYFNNAYNYGLAGCYNNEDSVINLENFLRSDLYLEKTKIIFFWVERSNENIDDLLFAVNRLAPGILHISLGNKHSGMINLIPALDSDVSATHPGHKTHFKWAKIIKVLISHARNHES
jgi:hypothetical protein